MSLFGFIAHKCAGICSQGSLVSDYFQHVAILLVISMLSISQACSSQCQSDGYLCRSCSEGSNEIFSSHIPGSSIETYLHRSPVKITVFIHFVSEGFSRHGCL